MHRLIAAVCLLVLPIFGAFPEICVRCCYEVPNSVLDSVAPSPTPPGWGGLQSRMYLNGQTTPVHPLEQQHREIDAGCDGQR